MGQDDDFVEKIWINDFPAFAGLKEKLQLMVMLR
jgi:hypothetical protein